MMVDKRFGQAGARLVIEELLVGREASFFVLSDGTSAIPLGSAEDHKRALDGDAGPNTGGMGAYAPSSLFDAATQARVMNEIVMPVLEGMRSEGSEFRGFLFVGLMLTADGPKVIEFNVRFGDPEAQVILPMIADDLSTLLMSAAAGELEGGGVSLASEPRVGVVLASGGYPDTYETGKVIHGLDAAEAIPDVNVFHSGTAKRGSDIVTAGGRVLTVVASGNDYQAAIDRAYEAVGEISSKACTIERTLEPRHSHESTTSSDFDGFPERRPGHAGRCRRVERAWHLGRDDRCVGAPIAGARHAAAGRGRHARRQRLHRRCRRRRASRRCRCGACDEAGHRRSDRLVGAQWARRAAVDRSDAAGRAGGHGVDRQGRCDERRRAGRADSRARRQGHRGAGREVQARACGESRGRRAQDSRPKR